MKPFPIVGINGAFTPWNIHRLNLSRLPLVTSKNQTSLHQWLNPHVVSMMSARERSLRKKHEKDTLMFVKDTLHTIIVRSFGIQGGAARRLFCLRDEKTNNSDTILFISTLRFDLHCHTVVCDGYVLSLTEQILMKNENAFWNLVNSGDMVPISASQVEMTAWKHLLPAFAERCRTTWHHGDNCEYKLQGKIPLTEKIESNPLCSCGMGKGVEGMDRVELWKKFAPCVTRIAISPLFAVSYLETVIRDPMARRCYVCRGHGKPTIQACSRCQKIRYCSHACQKIHWKAHKLTCRP